MSPAHFQRILLASSLAIATGLLPIAPAFAATSAQADFYGRRVMLQGDWKVIENTSDILRFEKTAGDSYLTLKKITASECTYGAINKAGRNAWGKDYSAKNLQLRNVTFGRTSRSGYRGYKWITPGGAKGVQHWCLGQEPKVAVELIAPLSDATLTSFVDKTLVYTFATRRGR